MDNVIEAGALAVLRDVQRAYEERMAIVNRIGGRKKLEMQVEVLQSWVSDMVAQNTLLATTVEELESEVTSKLLEQRRHTEIECELRAEVDALRRRLKRKDSDLRGLLEVLRRLRDFDFYDIQGIHFYEKDKKTVCDKVNEMKILNDSLKKENITKEREIRNLQKDVQHYEQIIMSLRNELSANNYQAANVIKRDVEVTANICCSNKQEQADVEPVKDSNATTVGEHPMYQESMHQLEHGAKSSTDTRSPSHLNVALQREVLALQRVCATLDEQCRVAALRAQFKDEVIHEMRRQLRQAKAKLKDVSESKSLSNQQDTHHDMKRKTSASYDSLTIACVQQQPRRSRRTRPDIDLNRWDNNSMMSDGAGDDASSKAE